MIDYMGQTLKIGDSVVTIDPKYKMLNHGEIISFTDKQVRIKSPQHNKPILRYPFVVIKVIKETDV